MSFFTLISFSKMQSCVSSFCIRIETVTMKHFEHIKKICWLEQSANPLYQKLNYFTIHVIQDFNFFCLYWCTKYKKKCFLGSFKTKRNFLWFHFFKCLFWPWMKMQTYSNKANSFRGFCDWFKKIKVKGIYRTFFANVW